MQNREVTQNPNEITPDRLVDLMNLVLAFDSYTKHLAQAGVPLDNVADEGKMLIRRFLDEVSLGVERYILPLEARADAAPLRPLLMIARRSGTPEVVASNNARLFEGLLPWILTRGQVFRGLFTGRGASIVRQIASLIEDESTASRLNKAASLPSVSGMTVSRKWIEKAAEMAGAPVTGSESLAADADEAKGIAETIRGVDAKLRAAGANTPQAAELQEQKTALTQQVDELAAASADPAVVKAVALVEQSKATDYATETGRRLKMTPDQEDAMTARGRVVIAAGAGSGKCIKGDTLVQTANGFFPIEELCAGLEAREDAPACMTVHGVNGQENTSHVYYDGFCHTKRIETSQGYEIEGTNKHKILTLVDGEVVFKRMADVELGDIVCLDRRPGLFAAYNFIRNPDEIHVRTSGTTATNVPPEMTTQVAALLGYIVSEGYIRQDSWHISLPTTDSEQYSLYQQAAEGLVSFTEKEDTRRTRQQILEIHRAADIQALIGFGLTRAKAQDKEIPVGVLRSTKPILAAFLKALFDGDGGVSANTVEYCTASEKLAYQLHTVLLGFGITCRRKFRPNAGLGAWHLSISGIGLRQFAAEIGFNLNTKQERLESLAKRNINTNVDVVPGVAHLCAAVKTKYKETFGTTKSDNPWYGVAKCIANGARNPSYASLEAFIDFYDVDCLERDALVRLVDAGWFFDTVVGVSDTETHVYDFVVPGTHTFSAGGFVNHNTRVLAGKVVYHVNELDIDPTAVLACSFTTKSSAELIKRVKDYGGVLEGPAMDGFGTTHSIAGKILNTMGRAFRRPAYIGKKEGYKQTILIRLAMEQVKMPGGRSLTPPEPKGLWADAFVSDTPTSAGDPVFNGVIQDARGYFEWALRVWDPKFKPWLQKSIEFLKDMQDKDPKRLSTGQRDYLNNLLSKVKRQGVNTITYRVAAGEDTDSPKRDKMSKYYFYKTPARQWFNLGRKLERSEGKPISVGEFKNAMSILKGQGISPTEAWAGQGPYGPESDEAAVYAAYEWLKGANGEPDFQGHGDMDDILIDTVKVLVGSPSARSALNSRYKVVLVDEAQDLNRCVHEDTFVQTPSGEIRVRDLSIGTEVLAYVNGAPKYKAVTAKALSSWTQGYRIVTTAGRELTMSPDHQIYASPLNEILKGQMALYLMYREGMGYRIGTSTRPSWRSEAGPGGRGATEWADCMWILEIGDEEEILYKEQAFSLQYQVPTYLYEGHARGCNQERIDRIFQDFGKNGKTLLDKYNLHPELPHWTNTTATTGRFDRKVVNLNAHRNRGTKTPQVGSCVSVSWTGEGYTGDCPAYTIKGGRKMINQLRASYAEARSFAYSLADEMGGRVLETLSIEGQNLPLITASGLFPGMKVPVTDQTGAVFLEEIECVEEVRGDAYYDITVQDAGNFFGNGILSHNCQHILFGLIAGYLDPQSLAPKADKKMSADTFALIGDDKQAIYEFRGADPEEFIDKSNMTPGGDNFDTKLLDTNFRSGRSIVDAANKLITHNCVEENTLISTPNGDIPAKLVQVGDEVLTYRNGLVVSRKVTETTTSDWTHGFQITTKSGHTLSMSPNHRLWASEPLLPDCSALVYLMFREGFGFRVGTTSHGGRLTRGEKYNLSLGIRAAMEYGERMWVLGMYSSVEQALCDETLISLRFSIPQTTFNAGERGPSQERIKTIFKDFGQNGLRLLESRHLSFDLPHWSAQSQRRNGRTRKVITFIAHGGRGSQVYLRGDDGQIHTRRQFASYDEAQTFAAALRYETGSFVSEKMSVEGADLRLMTASALIPGMFVPILDNGQITLQEIDSIVETKGIFLDIGVEETCNFFGNGVLSHNSKQIPMVCKANVDRKGEGYIAHRQVENVKDAAVTVASEVADFVKTAPDGEGKYKNFGVAVRSNAEAYQYGLEMLKRGIPFKSNANFFNDRNTKALIGWLTIAELGLSGPPEKANPAVVAATAAPYSNLGPIFKTSLEAKASGNWAQWLVNGGYNRIYSRPDMTEVLEHFVKNIEIVSKFSGSPAQVLGEIMALVGADGQDIRTAMVKAVEENDEVMSELASEAEGGKVSQEQIEEHALAPIDPLIGLMANQSKLDEAMAYVRKLQAVNDRLATRDTEDEIDRDAVTISTMHGWKGLEVPNLYLPMVGGKFPRCPVGKDSSGQVRMRASAPEGPDLWSERRLAYVAITRAENRCTILNIPHPKFGVRSQFISEACIPMEGKQVEDQVDETIESLEDTTNKMAAGKWSDDVLAALTAEMFDFDFDSPENVETEWNTLDVDPLETEWDAPAPEWDDLPVVDDPLENEWVEDEGWEAL